MTFTYNFIVIDGDGKLKKKMVSNKDNKDVINLKAFFSRSQCVLDQTIISPSKFTSIGFIYIQKKINVA